MDPTTPAKHCNCMHHKVMPIAIILIGLAFLLQDLNILSVMFVAYTWPVLLIIIGVVKLFGRSCKCC